MKINNGSTPAHTNVRVRRNKPFRWGRGRGKQEIRFLCTPSCSSCVVGIYAYTVQFAGHIILWRYEPWESHRRIIIRHYNIVVTAAATVPHCVALFSGIVLLIKHNNTEVFIYTARTFGSCERLNRGARVGRCRDCTAPGLWSRNYNISSCPAQGAHVYTLVVCALRYCHCARCTARILHTNLYTSKCIYIIYKCTKKIRTIACPGKGFNYASNGPFNILIPSVKRPHIQITAANFFVLFCFFSVQ